MGKGARIRRERELGVRKKNGQGWLQVKGGQILWIPKFTMLGQGITPTITPIPRKGRRPDER